MKIAPPFIHDQDDHLSTPDTQVLISFKPYLPQFQAIRLPRDFLSKELKLAIPTHSHWASLIFKSLYPASAAKKSGPSAAPTKSNVPQIREDPTKLVKKWEFLLKKVVLAKNRSSHFTLDDHLRALENSSLVNSSTKKKSGKKKSQLVERDPSIAVVSSNFMTGCDVLLHLFQLWIKQHPRLTQLPHVVPCELSSALSTICASLQYRPRDKDADPNFLRNVSHCWNSTYESAVEQGNSEHEHLDYSISQSIFLAIEYHKTFFSTQSSRIFNILQHKRVFQTVDPSLLSHPSTIDQEQLIADDPILKFNSSVLTKYLQDRQLIWNPILSLLLSLKHIELCILVREGLAFNLILASSNESATTLIADPVSKTKLNTFEKEWTRVQSAFKNKRRLTDTCKIVEINIEFESYVNSIVTAVTNLIEVTLPEFINDINGLCEQSITNILIPLSSQFKSIYAQHIEPIFSESETSPSTDESPIIKDEAMMNELCESLITQSNLVLESVHAKTTSMLEWGKAQLTRIQILADNLISLWEIPTGTPESVNNRLNRGTKVEVRRMIVQFEKQVSSFLEKFYASYINLFTTTDLHSITLKWLTCFIYIVEFVEEKLILNKHTEHAYEIKLLTKKRDSVRSTYLDGIEAGLLSLELTFRNVIVYEMAMLTTREKAKMMELELFDSKALKSGSGKKKKPAPKKPLSIDDLSITNVIVNMKSAESNHNFISTTRAIKPCLVAQSNSNRPGSTTKINGILREIPKEILDIMHCLNEPSPEQSRNELVADPEGLSLPTADPFRSLSPCNGESAIDAADQPQPVLATSFSNDNLVHEQAELDLEPEIVVQAGVNTKRDENMPYVQHDHLTDEFSPTATSATDLFMSNKAPDVSRSAYSAGVNTTGDRDLAGNTQKGAGIISTSVGPRRDDPISPSTSCPYYDANEYVTPTGPITAWGGLDVSAMEPPVNPANPFKLDTIAEQQGLRKPIKTGGPNISTPSQQSNAGHLHELLQRDQIIERLEFENQKLRGEMSRTRTEYESTFAQINMQHQALAKAQADQILDLRQQIARFSINIQHLWSNTVSPTISSVPPVPTPIQRTSQHPRTSVILPTHASSMKKARPPGFTESVVPLNKSYEGPVTEDPWGETPSVSTMPGAVVEYHPWGSSPSIESSGQQQHDPWAVEEPAAMSSGRQKRTERPLVVQTPHAQVSNGWEADQLLDTTYMPKHPSQPRSRPLTGNINSKTFVVGGTRTVKSTRVASKRGAVRCAVCSQRGHSSEQCTASA